MTMLEVNAPLHFPLLFYIKNFLEVKSVLLSAFVNNRQSIQFESLFRIYSASL